MLSVKVEGLKALDKEIKKMSFRDRKKVLTSAVRKGANVVRKKARQLVPVGKGDLKKSIRTMTEQANDGAIGYVDARHFTAHMIEFGTSPHGGHPGTAPQSFIRAAFDNTRAEQLMVIEKAIKEAIQKVK